MIAACPRCSSRYRIDSERLRAEGVRLRCSRCDAVFRVRPPVAAASPTSATPQAQEKPRPAPVAAPAPAQEPVQQPAPTLPPAAKTVQRPDALEDMPPADRERLVLIADPEVEQGKMTASALADWGLQPILVHDGVEAIMSIQRMLPRVIVLDAALPKMFGFQVCELVKRNESLRHMQVVLIGAIHDKNRYRRAPAELYGADAYLERQQLPEPLRELLRGFGMPIGGAEPEPVAPAPAPAAPAAPTSTPEVRELPPVVAPPMLATPPPATAPEIQPSPPVELATPPVESAPEPTAPPAAESESLAQAERLARIVVSDIVLYNEEKFAAAVAAGNVLEAMENELAEGRSLFVSRIDESLRGQRDFLVEELLRAAQRRSER